MKDERELRSGVRCILFVGLLSVIEVLISLYLNRHSNVEYTSQFAIIGMLLYLWIVYLGYGWTIGYEKIFAHGIWFFKEENVILTTTAKKTFLHLYIPHIICSVILFCWFIFLSFPLFVVFPAGKIVLILFAYDRLFIKTA